MSYKTMGQNTRILFDLDKCIIRVSEYRALVPGFRAQWQSCGNFTEMQWYESCYASMVTDTEIEEMIIYFWIDLEEEVS